MLMNKRKKKTSSPASAPKRWISAIHPSSRARAFLDYENSLTGSKNPKFGNKQVDDELVRPSASLITSTLIQCINSTQGRIRQELKPF